MESLTERVLAARQDKGQLSALISDYLPFIKSELAKTGDLGLEYDDRLSLAMLTFMNCARQYDVERGAFLPFAAVCMRNRLIDEARRQHRHSSRAIAFDAQAGEEQAAEAGEAEKELAMQEYSREEERRALAEEIEALAAELEEYGVSFRGLSEAAPKQQRSRRLSGLLARAVVQQDALRQSFSQTRRLPRAALAGQFGISEKTIEKHRRYILTLAVVWMGDYPGIQAFLPDPGGGMQAAQAQQANAKGVAAQ